MLVWRLLIVVTAAGAMLRCIVPSEPPLPRGAVAMQPLRPYAFWWEMTERCSGRSGDFDRVQWYVMPNATAFEIRGREYNGYWFPQDGGSIVLAEGSTHAGPLVRHEMLHALLGGPAGHNRQYFVDGCQGVVACIAECATEAGDLAQPDESAPVLPPSALALSMIVDPVALADSANEGWIAVSVTVRNDSPTDGWIPLSPTSPGSEYFASLGLIIECLSECSASDETSQRSLETVNRLGIVTGSFRRKVFDLKLAPGTYQVRGTFQQDTTTATRVVVGH